MAAKKAAAAEIPPDIQRLTFEEAMGELEGIVRSLEQGSGSLDQAIDAYARGVALKTHCETKLKEAQLRVEKIVIGAGGTPAAEAFDPE